jgi:hypothetical protein
MFFQVLVVGVGIVSETANASPGVYVSLHVLVVGVGTLSDTVKLSVGLG